MTQEASSFERELLAEIRKLKANLARCDEGLNGFTLEISATGRLDGDVAVSFELSDWYGGQKVTAGSIAAALQEFLRRRSWTAMHAPLCLPNVAPMAAAEPEEPS